MRPYVIINCAMSADGKIALPSRIQTRISNEEDIRRVYELRNRCDAILVGINTVLSDDPKLIVKSEYVKKRKKPIRIVLDSKGRVPMNAKILDSSAKTIVVTSEQCKRKITKAEVIKCGNSRVDLHRALSILYDRGIKSLLIEGGETVIWSFLKEGLADELHIFIGSMIIGGKKSPTLAGGDGAQCFKDIIPLTLRDVRIIGDGVLLQYMVK